MGFCAKLDAEASSSSYSLLKTDYKFVLWDWNGAYGILKPLTSAWRKVLCRDAFRASQLFGLLLPGFSAATLTGRRAVGIPAGFHRTSGCRHWLYPSRSRRSKDRRSPAARCPWLSTPRRTAQRGEIRINLKSDMLILTPALPLFAQPLEKPLKREGGLGWGEAVGKMKVEVVDYAQRREAGSKA
ncbi:hypothetical protein SRHO_G00116420 [Serrasalmus rhombeus]